MSFRLSSWLCRTGDEDRVLVRSHAAFLRLTQAVQKTGCCCGAGSLKIDLQALIKTICGQSVGGETQRLLAGEGKVSFLF